MNQFAEGFTEVVEAGVGPAFRPFDAIKEGGDVDELGAGVEEVEVEQF